MKASAKKRRSPMDPDLEIRLKKLFGALVPLDKLQYVLLPYQDSVPTTTPADLHPDLKQLTDMVDSWGRNGWFFPDATVVKDPNTNFPGQFGFRLRSGCKESKALIAVRRIADSITFRAS
jgi:hypothetical protein